MIDGSTPCRTDSYQLNENETLTKSNMQTHFVETVFQQATIYLNYVVFNL